MVLKVLTKKSFSDLTSLLSVNDSKYIKTEKKDKTRISLECNPEPDDAFRWSILQDIVANQDDLVCVHRVGIGDHLLPCDSWKNGKKVAATQGVALLGDKGQLTLSALGARGYTMISVNLAKSLSEYEGPVSKPPNNESHVFHALLDEKPTSLAHELFGHYYLYMIGAPGGHNAMIEFRHCVPSPFEGIQFVGKTDTFITNSVNVEGKLVSPTLKTDKTHVEKAFKTLVQTFPNPKDSTKYTACWIELAYYYDFVTGQDIQLVPSLRGLPFGKNMAKAGKQGIDDIDEKTEAYAKEISKAVPSPGEILLQLLQEYYTTLTKQSKDMFANLIRKSVKSKEDLYKEFKLGKDLLEKIKSKPSP